MISPPTAPHQKRYDQRTPGDSTSSRQSPFAPISICLLSNSPSISACLHQMESASLQASFGVPATFPSQTPSPFLTLPNEVLHKIFSYLPNPTDLRILQDFFYASPMQRRLFQPVMIVRQVCSRFRIVANELDFWYDDEFE